MFEMSLGMTVRKKISIDGIVFVNLLGRPSCLFFFPVTESIRIHFASSALHECLSAF